LKLNQTGKTARNLETNDEQTFQTDSTFQNPSIQNNCRAAWQERAPSLTCNQQRQVTTFTQRHRSPLATSKLEAAARSPQKALAPPSVNNKCQLQQTKSMQ